MTLLKRELIKLDNSLKLEFKKFYFGVSEGDFSTCYPYARVIFCIDCNKESFWLDPVKNIRLTAGMWLVIPPFVKVTHHHKHNLQLSIHFSYALLSGLELLAGIKEVQFGTAPELTGLVKSIDPDEPLQFTNCANLLVRNILHKLMPLLKTVDSGDMKLIRYNRLTAYLHQRHNPHVTVAEMAKVMNLCEQTFARKFAAETGLTPRKLNENIIIHHAVSLLENENLSIKEIADELHFSNEYYFSRFFKRNTGLPPGKFRNRKHL